MRKEIVIARYNEAIVKWIDDIPDDVSVIIYNKGGNKFDFCSKVRSRASDIRKLPNTGREGHTYLTHIVDNYDNLADITFFCQGNPIPHLKRKKISSYFDILDTTTPVSKMQLASNKHSRSATGWHKKDMPEHITKVIRGNGRWSSKKAAISFPQWWLKYVKQPHPDSSEVQFSWGGIFSVTNAYVWTHSRKYYKKILQSVSGGIDPEEGHFLERAWSYIFKPTNNNG